MIKDFMSNLKLGFFPLSAWREAEGLVVAPVVAGGADTEHEREAVAECELILGKGLEVGGGLRGGGGEGAAPAEPAQSIAFMTAMRIATSTSSAVPRVC